MISPDDLNYEIVLIDDVSYSVIDRDESGEITKTGIVIWFSPIGNGIECIRLSEDELADTPDLITNAKIYTHPNTQQIYGVVIDGVEVYYDAEATVTLNKEQ
jgi:hypothetical protein